MSHSDHAPVRVDADSRAVHADREQRHWEQLEALTRGMPLSELCKHGSAFIRRRELAKMLAQYELFRLIIELPGSIAELGVFHGAGFFLWAKLLETFCPGDRSRMVYGFDHFGGYLEADARDGDAINWIERTTGRFEGRQALVEGLVQLHNADNLIPGVERCRLVPGEIEQTVPAFTAGARGVRLSMLYFDVNLYRPTLVGLQQLYPLVVAGGVVAFNAYGGPPWEGEAAAIEEFWRDHGGPPVMRKFPFSPWPSAYFRKPGGASA